MNKVVGEFWLGIGVLLISIASCKESNKTISNLSSDVPIDTIHVLKKDEFDYLKSSKFVNSFRFLTLKTEGDFLGRFDKIRLYNGVLFILDRTRNMVVAFDHKTGEELFRIAEEGEGPGQYGSADDFSINRFNKTLEILYRRGQMTLAYDLESGQFIREIPYSFYSYFFNSFSSGDKLFFNGVLPNSLDPKDSINAQMFNADSENNLVSIAYPMTWEAGKMGHSTRRNLTSYGTTDKVNFVPYYSSKVYKIGSDGFLSGYHLSFDGRPTSDEALVLFTGESRDWARFLYNRTQPYINNITDFFENDFCLSFMYADGPGRYFFFYDKSSKKGVSLKHLKDDLGVLAVFPIGITDTELIASVAYEEIDGRIELLEMMVEDKEELKERSDYQQLVSIRNASKSPNPILVFYDLKIDEGL